MANMIHEFDPVTHITAGAVGKPGHRTFYIQAERGDVRLTVVCEKEHVAALADTTEEMLKSLVGELGLSEVEEAPVDAGLMAIREPVDPLFRVGAIALGYDSGRDRILLVVQEAMDEDESGEPAEVRLFATRAQMRALATHAQETVKKGRSPEQRALQAGAHARRNGHDE